MSPMMRVLRFAGELVAAGELGDWPGWARGAWVEGN